MRWRRALLVFLFACGSRTALIAPEEDVDENDASIVDGSVRRRDAGSDVTTIEDVREEPVFDPSCVADAGPPSSISACKAKLTMMAIQKSMPSCFVDVVAMEGDTATLEYDCTPSGNARVVVNGKTFVGIYDGKTLDVCSGTMFPWSDGCQWKSAQHFRGDPKSGFLTFTYSETPFMGTGCQPPCQAFATVKVN